MNETYQINIGNRKVNFDIHDEIFKLSKANSTFKDRDKCYGCEKDFSKIKQKQKHFW